MTSYIIIRCPGCKQELNYNFSDTVMMRLVVLSCTHCLALVAAGDTSMLKKTIPYRKKTVQSITQEGDKRRAHFLGRT